MLKLHEVHGKFPDRTKNQVTAVWCVGKVVGKTRDTEKGEEEERQRREGTVAHVVKTSLLVRRRD